MHLQLLLELILQQLFTLMAVVLDVFVYYVEGTFVNGEEFKQKGTVTLIRR